MIKQTAVLATVLVSVSVMAEELLTLRVALLLREKKFWFQANFAYIVTYNPTLLLS